MASTGAVLYIKPRYVVTVAANHTTGLVLYINPRANVTVAANHITGVVLYHSVRAVSGLYSVTGVAASADTTNLKSWLPHISVDIVDKNGKCDPQWYRFFHYFANVKMGGPNAPS